MKSFHEHTTNRIFYIGGLILLLPLAILCLLQNAGWVTLTESLYPCVFRRLSGLYCPGCGGTRAVQALLEGNFLACFFYHPFVLYCAILYALFMLSHTLELIFTCKFFKSRQCSYTKKSSHEKPFVRGLNFNIRYVYIGILVILLQWMLKNLFLIGNSY